MIQPKTQAEARKRLSSLEAEMEEIKSFLLKQTSVNIMERVKTFDDALEIYKQDHDISSDMQAILDYKGNDTGMIAMQGFAQINIIRAVLNEGWAPNWYNENEYKYYPWFKMFASGLSYDDCIYARLNSVVGSRLCYKSLDLAKYAGTQFIDIYQKFYTI